MKLKNWLLWGLCLISTTQAVIANEVNLYSAREEVLIKPLLDAFTQATGIKVNLVAGDADALLKRLESEKNNSPADVYLTTDVGRLIRAQQSGVLQVVTSPILTTKIPEQYRDEQGYWFGLSVRSRVIVYAKDRVKPQEIVSYDDLASEKWRGKVCVRSSNNVYNQSLVAARIARYGVEKTEAWAGGLVANFGRPPAGGDRDQIKAIAAGQCDLALVNTYYFGVMLHADNPAEQAAAAKVALLWPDQNSYGAHVNISGAGITQSAKHRAEALKLIEFLSEDQAQQWYADKNFEFPIRSGIATNETLTSWGEFKADDLKLSELAKYNAEAVKLMDRAGWK